MRPRTPSKKVTPLSHSNFPCLFDTQHSFDWITTTIGGRRPNEASTMPKTKTHQSPTIGGRRPGRRPNEASTMPKTKTHQSDRGCIWLG